MTLMKWPNENEIYKVILYECNVTFFFFFSISYGTVQLEIPKSTSSFVPHGADVNVDQIIRKSFFF